MRTIHTGNAVYLPEKNKNSIPLEFKLQPFHMCFQHNIVTSSFFKNYTSHFYCGKFECYKKQKREKDPHDPEFNTTNQFDIFFAFMFSLLRHTVYIILYPNVSTKYKNFQCC